MMVLDASALLALMYEETGRDQVQTAIVEGAAMSAANISEVVARMLLDGWKMQAISHVIRSFKLDIIPVDWEAAMLAAEYRVSTKHLGLGLGDRLCLATANLFNMPVLTADQVWRKIDVRGLSVKLIR